MRFCFLLFLVVSIVGCGCPIGQHAKCVGGCKLGVYCTPDRELL